MTNCRVSTKTIQTNMPLLTDLDMHSRTALLPDGGGGASHMKQTEMLVVSLQRGVNFGHRITRRETEVKFSFQLCLLCLYIIKTHCMSYLCVSKRFLLGVKICLSHAQIGLL